MRDVLSFRRERVHEKIDSKKIVQTQNQKYPTNRSRCNTYLVYIFSYPVVWTFSCVCSYFSHLGNHYSAVIHPRFFSINHTIHDLKLSVGDVTETTVRDPHSYTTTVCQAILFFTPWFQIRGIFSKSFYKYDVAYCILIKLRRFCGKFYRNSKFKHNMIILMTSYSIHTYTTCSSFITIIIRK